jgi:hypothetical protein
MNVATCTFFCAECHIHTERPLTSGYVAYPRGLPGLYSGLDARRGIPVAVVARDPAWRPLPLAVHTMWMSQPCRSSCMKGTFTSYAVVRMMPAGQATQQQRRTTRSNGPATSAAPGPYLRHRNHPATSARARPPGGSQPRPAPLQPQKPYSPQKPQAGFTSQAPKPDSMVVAPCQIDSVERHNH